MMTIGTSIAMSLFTYNTTSASDSTGGGSEGSGGSGSELLFDAQHPSDVSCTDIKWSKTQFYGTNGNLVGTTYVQNGVIKSEYTGSYHSKIESSGIVAPFTGKKIDCYGWGMGCDPVSAVEACAGK